MILVQKFKNFFVSFLAKPSWELLVFNILDRREAFLDY